MTPAPSPSSETPWPLARATSRALGPDRCRSLSGQVALVTGGAQRVGAAVALTLAQAGCDVAITCRNSRSEAAAVARQIAALGRRALVIPVDLAKPDVDVILHRAFIKQFQRLDILIHNAAAYDVTPLGQITAAAFDVELAVNARAPLLITQRFAPLLTAGARRLLRGPSRGSYDPATLGRVVTFIDMHILGQHRVNYLAYSASKAALWEITQSLARELAPKATVNAIAPGVIAWEKGFTPAQRRRYLRRIPLARPGTPADAAAAVLFLVRDAHYTTGQVLRLDGGRLLT